MGHVHRDTFGNAEQGQANNTEQDFKDYYPQAIEVIRAKLTAKAEADINEDWLLEIEEKQPLTVPHLFCGAVATLVFVFDHFCG